MAQPRSHRDWKTVFAYDQEGRWPVHTVLPKRQNEGMYGPHEVKTDVCAELEREVPALAEDGDTERANDWEFFDVHVTIGERWGDHLTLNFNDPADLERFAAEVSAQAALVRAAHSDWLAARAGAGMEPDGGGE